MDWPGPLETVEEIEIETSRGGEQTISTTKYEVTGRGGKGRDRFTA